MKKIKFLKTFSFASLALLMGAAGVFAFAPLGVSPSVASANEITESTTEQGLITPKADDPVIYTTESGIEIKWGNALPSTSAYLTSSNLKGFPYFTTTASSTTYTWVIIGTNSNVPLLNMNTISNYLFSNWESTTSDTLINTSNTSKGYYFFNNQFDCTTPAGLAVYNNMKSRSYVIDVGSIKTNNTEIPSGCVLVLSNSVITTSIMYSNKELLSNGDIWNGTYNRVTNLLNSYYSSDTFGFGTLKSSIQSSTLYQYQWHYTANVGTAIVNKMYSSSNTFFVLDAGKIDGTNYNWPTYLTAAQYAPSENVWCRSMTTTQYYYYTNTSGSITTGLDCAQLVGVRPACVIKLF